MLSLRNGPLLVLLGLTILAVAGVGLTNAVPLDGDRTPPVEEFEHGTSPLRTDTDGDGLEDTAEVAGPSNPTVGDTDDDGIDDGRELELGSRPDSADSDADRVPDGEELAIGTNPLRADTDTDGLADDRELDLGLPPTDPDADRDGVVDGAETDVAGLDPHDPDSDGDGLRDGPERERGIEPTEPDTDDDGLDDGRESSLGTDPGAADSDGDGLDDRPELERGTDPSRVSSDGDALGDGRELELGTDPRSADTDGDNLLDGWEVDGESSDGAPLPDSDPLRMDLYLHVVVTQNADPLSDAERDRIREAWAEMPVGNPDGSTGIAIHVEQERYEESLTYDGRPEQLFVTFYYEELESAKRGVYHEQVILPFAESMGDVGGTGQTPGTFSIVADDWDDYVQDRYVGVVHEVLHNVMGQLDAENRCGDDAHSCRGWLAHDGSGEYLPESLAAELEANGFA